MMNNPRTIRNIFLSIGVALTLFAPLADAQRANVGDLVEYTLGPALAEIVAEPDASGYVLIQLPTGKRVPVNTQKLRLVQKAGTPNAAIDAGAAVSWVESNVKENGSVVKVNGNWCQVKTPSATTIGWVECKALRVAGAAAPAKSDKPAPAANAAGGAAASLKLPGNWENADGSVKLEFQAANKCYISWGWMTSPCTYNQNAQGVAVNFNGENLALTANDDGSLGGAEDAMMPIRLKKK
jgi:hypothetical protein